MTWRWCLVAAMTLVPGLSWVLVWAYTENVRDRWVERGKEYSQRLVWAEESRDRLEQDNGNLSRRLDEAEAARDRSARRLRLSEQDYSSLRQVLNEQSSERILALLEQQNNGLRLRLGMAQANVSRLQDENERLRVTPPRAALEEVDRLRDENGALAEQSKALGDENMDLEDEVGRLRADNAALGELGILQRVSTTWISGFAVAGLLAFTVLQHYTGRLAFVDAVRSERDQLKTQLQELARRTDGLEEAAVERDAVRSERDQLKTQLQELARRTDGLEEAAVERDRLKRRVKRLENKAAGAARERDQLKTRLQEVEGERDGLQTRVRRLQHEAAELANVVRERDRLRTRLREVEVERDGLQRRVRHLEREAAEFANRRAEPGSHAAGLALLGLVPPVTPETARTAYRRLSRTIHPDVCKGPEAGRLMRLATECYERIVKT